MHQPSKQAEYGFLIRVIHALVCKVSRSVEKPVSGVFIHQTSMEASTGKRNSRFPSWSGLSMGWWLAFGTFIMFKIVSFSP